MGEGKGGGVCFHTTWHRGADHKVHSQQHLVPGDEGQDMAMPTHLSPKHVSGEVTALQGRREAELASRNSDPTEGKLTRGQGQPPPHPNRKGQRFCQLRASPWSLAVGFPVTLKAHGTGPHCSSQVSPCASPPGPSFKRMSAEHLLCARTLGGQAMKAAQGNHGVSHLESPSCKSPGGWLGADGQLRPLLVHPCCNGLFSKSAS